jgi:hypothetical protein
VSRRAARSTRRQRRGARIRMSVSTGAGYVGFRVEGEPRTLTPAEARELGEQLRSATRPVLIPLRRGAVEIAPQVARVWGDGLIGAAAVAEAEARGTFGPGGEA